MKYEEIEAGESYEYGLSVERVIYKIDKYKVAVTVDEDDSVTTWKEDEIQHFKPIKKELPESGLLVCTDGAIVYRTGERSGFGFNSLGKYEKKSFWSFISNPECWRTATPEEEAKFIKLLKAEAEKRGLGVDAKIKGHADGMKTAFNKNAYAPEFSLNFAFNNHGRIFHNGIWAQPLTMLDEVTEVIKKHLPNIVVEMTDGVVTLKQL